MNILKVILLVPILLFAIDSTATDHYTETRYCGEPERDARGRIKRDRTLVRKFKELYPLPDGYDPSEWHVDHVIPVKNGGCDAMWNLQWLHVDIKNCAGDICKDRWEREVYPTNY